MRFQKSIVYLYSYVYFALRPTLLLIVIC